MLEASLGKTAGRFPRYSQETDNSNLAGCSLLQVDGLIGGFLKRPMERLLEERNEKCSLASWEFPIASHMNGAMLTEIRLINNSQLRLLEISELEVLNKFLESFTPEPHFSRLSRLYYRSSTKT
jgi:hypothetical protein